MKGARYGQTATNFHSNSSKSKSLIMLEMVLAMYSLKAVNVGSETGTLGTVAEHTSRSAARHTSGGMLLACSISLMLVWMLVSVLSALVHTVRASGSDISFARRSIAGISSGRKGFASLKSSMSFDMLSAITATLRLISVFFSWQPRSRMGTVIASAAESTDCTNTVDESLCTVSGTSEGFWIALMSSGTKGLMSRFDTESQHCLIAAVAHSFTSFFVSHIAADTTGIASGRQRENGSGCFSAICPIMRQATTLICHLVSWTPTYSMRRIDRHAHGHATVQMSLSAPSAVVRISAFLWAQSLRRSGMKGTIRGSDMVVVPVAREAIAVCAFSLVLTSSNSFLIVSIAPDWMRARGPASFTVLAMSSAVKTARSLDISPESVVMAFWIAPMCFMSTSWRSTWLKETLSKEYDFCKALGLSSAIV
mmetsp:Transcript_68334/g.142421  ORF Transcript_68334/g.142421 Transcript_68334/m.142421 type:complete len:423 (+) Transcript_68334:2010-3278(+)